MLLEPPIAAGDRRMTAAIATPSTPGPSLHASGAGGPHPLGATPDAEGTNFALFSRHATSVELLLFERHDSPSRSRRSSSTRPINRTFHFWHVYVVGVTPGMGYAYRVDGPKDLHGAGHRFNPNKVLIDPYGRGTTSTLWDRVAACGPDDNLAHVAAQRRHRHDRLRLGGRPAAQPADAGDGHLRDARRAASPSRRPSGVDATRARTSASIEKIPYLKSLGVTAVELLPVFEFDEDEISGTNPLTGQQLDQLLGLQPDRLLRPARGLLRRARRGLATSASSGTWSRPSTRPASRSSSTSSSTTPARATTRARRSASGASTTASTTTSSRTTSSSTRTSPAAATRSTATTRWSRSSSSSACGTGSARCTSTASASTSPRSFARRRTATPMDDPPVLWHIELDDDAGRHQDHRRGLGRRRAVPGRLLPGLPLGRVERPVPRRRPPLRQGRPGPRRRGRRADRRQRRPLPGRRRAADQQHQLHHLPRRLHAQRPGLLQRQAQRGQRRGQPRRHRRQPQLELRRRGRHGRPGDRGAARPPGPQLPDDPDAVAGRADDGHGRRGAPDAARQQQRLLPGQRDHLVRLDAGRASTPTCSASPASSSPSARRTRRSGAPRSSPARSTSAAWPTSRGTAAGSFARAGTTRSRGSSPSRSAASRCRATGKSSPTTPTST